MADDLKNEEFKPDRPIEVTEAMVDAGARIVSHFHPDFSDAQEVARDVFEAMIAAKASGYRHRA